MHYIKIVTLTLISFLILSSCQDDPTSLGKDLLGTELDILVLDSQKDSLTQHTGSFVADSLAFGSSIRLILGSVEDLKSTMLMRFGLILPDSVRTSLINQSLTILSAETELRPIYRIGEETEQFDFSVHKIISDWGTRGFNKDSLAALTYEQTELTESKQITDSLITFNINANVALEWLEGLISDTLGTNNGMIFLPNEAAKRAFGFRAHPFTTNDDSPIIRYIIQDEEQKIDTLISRVIFDVHVVEGTTQPAPAQRFQMTAGIGERGKLFFDLSDLPRNANINRAELSLTVDTLASLLGNSAVDSLRVRLFSDSSNYKINSDQRLQRIIYDGVTFKGDISRLVQTILLGSDNQGFRLVLGNESESLNRYVLYGSNYTDEALRPKLKIFYNVIE